MSRLLPLRHAGLRSKPVLECRRAFVAPTSGGKQIGSDFRSSHVDSCNFAPIAEQMSATAHYRADRPAAVPLTLAGRNVFGRGRPGAGRARTRLRSFLTFAGGN